MRTSAESGPIVIHHTHPDHRLDTAAVEALVRHIADGENQPLAAVSIVLADHAQVLQLNRDYLDHDYHTDVLSFDLSAPDDEAVEGEVYVDLDTAAERHREFDTPFETEALRYVAHGVLHLMGYDDATPDGQSTMRALEDRYLRAANLL